MDGVRKVQSRKRWVPLTTTLSLLHHSISLIKVCLVFSLKFRIKLWPEGAATSYDRLMWASRDLKIQPFGKSKCVSATICTTFVWPPDHYCQHGRWSCQFKTLMMIQRHCPSRWSRRSKRGQLCWGQRVTTVRDTANALVIMGHQKTKMGH